MIKAACLDFLRPCFSGQNTYITAERRLMTGGTAPEISRFSFFRSGNPFVVQDQKAHGDRTWTGGSLNWSDLATWYFKFARIVLNYIQSVTARADQDISFV